MKITAKQDKSVTIQPEEDKSVDNKLELLKYTAEVQSRIREDIRSDFILAKLGDQDKEGVIEMTSNAYFFKRLAKIIQNNGKKWEWDNKNKAWLKRKLVETEMKAIKNIANSTFDSYMTRIFMTVILNRNVSKNHILKVLSGYNSDDEEEEGGTSKKAIDKAKIDLAKQLQPNQQGA